VKRLLLLVALVALPRVAAAQQAETVEYYGSDLIGSIRIVFDAYGNVIGRQDFAPFGVPVQVTAPVPKEGFGGQEKDEESNQAYFHARMFEMRTGRFGAPDPIEVGDLEPQRWNRYAYGLNAPLSFIDPDGLNACGAGFCSTSVPACDAFDCDGAGFFDGFYSLQDAFGDTFHESYSDRRPRPTRPTATPATTQPGTDKPADPPSGNPPPGNPPKPKPPTCDPTQQGACGPSIAKAWIKGFLDGASESCAGQHYGLSAAATISTAAAYPISKRALGFPVLPGTSEVTNPLSMLAGKLTWRLPFRILGTNNALRAVGRLNPYIALGLMTYDVYEIGSCILD